MKALAFAFLLVLLPVSADAMCWSHKPKVESVQIVNGVPVGVKTVVTRKPDGFCQTVLRASGMSIAVNAVVTVLKVGILVVAGIPIL